jgi:hypothetical protein
MGFINWFKGMMKDSITYAPLSSRDAYGKPTYGTAVTYSARVTNKKNKVTRKDGQEVVSNTMIRLYSNVATLTVEGKVTMADGTTPTVLTIDHFPDETGPCTTVIYV